MEHVSRKQLELYTDLKSRGSRLQSDKDLLSEVSQLLERMQKLQIETAYSEGEASSPPTASSLPTADSQASAPSTSEASSTSTTMCAAARALAYHIANDRANAMSSAAGELFTMAFSIAMDSVEEKKEDMEKKEYIPSSSRKRESFFRRTGRSLHKAQADVLNKCLGVAETSGGGVEGDVEVARRVVEVLSDLVKMIDRRREALEALEALDDLVA